MNKLISISVWGDNPRYVVGARRQIELARKFLADWQVRIYTDDSTKFSNLDVDVVECKGNAGMYWRFFPLFSDEFDVVASRDSDSRFSIRECKALNEFVVSDKQFHVIRDHESHFEFPVMAGLFARKNPLKASLLGAMKEYMSKNTYYTCDQNFLRDFVWPYVEFDTLVHSMNEGWFGDTRNKLKNRFSFVGNGYDENDMPLYAPTLQECIGFDPKSLDKTYKFDEGIYDLYV